MYSSLEFIFFIYTRSNQEQWKRFVSRYFKDRKSVSDAQFDLFVWEQYNTMVVYFLLVIKYKGLGTIGEFLILVSSPGECRFPNWLTGHSSSGLTWHTLDLGRSYTFHPRNASLHVARPNATSSSTESGSMDSQYVPGPKDQDMKILCNSIKQSNDHAQTMTMTMLVAHFTAGW